MTEFKPDCTINLHVEMAGKPAKVSWSCSIVHYKHGRMILAKKYLGQVPREEAELEALNFGLRQTARLLQEKVELNATFPLEGKLQAPRGKIEPALKQSRENVVKAWEGFRLRRVSRMKGEEAKVLRDATLTASEKKRSTKDD